MRSLCRVDLLVLDDRGPEPLNAEQRRDLLEIVEDRYDPRSIMITSQVPVDRWYEIIGDPVLADAILDPLVHNAYRLERSGDTLRKTNCRTDHLTSTPKLIITPTDPLGRRHRWPAFTSDSWPALVRNRGRLQAGMHGRLRRKPAHRGF
jgi:IstB-like ATP binding protein